jgi:hypothetical protein
MVNASMYIAKYSRQLDGDMGGNWLGDGSKAERIPSSKPSEVFKRSLSRSLSNTIRRPTYTNTMRRMKAQGDNYSKRKRHCSSESQRMLKNCQIFDKTCEPAEKNRKPRMKWS